MGERGRWRSIKALTWEPSFGRSSLLLVDSSRLVQTKTRYHLALNNPTRDSAGSVLIMHRNIFLFYSVKWIWKHVKDAVDAIWWRDLQPDYVQYCPGHHSISTSVCTEHIGHQSLDKHASVRDATQEACWHVDVQEVTYLDESVTTSSNQSNGSGVRGKPVI